MRHCLPLLAVLFAAAATCCAAVAAAEPPHVELDPPAAVTVVPLPLDPPVAPPEGVYGGWGQGAIGPDGRFYVAVGNHLTDGDADAWLFAYDPQTGGVETVFSTRDAAGGWEPGTLGDGKLHTGIDVAPDGTTWLVSFYGNYPRRERTSRAAAITAAGCSERTCSQAKPSRWACRCPASPADGPAGPPAGKLVAVGESGLYQLPGPRRRRDALGYPVEGEGGRYSHGRLPLTTPSIAA